MFGAAFLASKPIPRIREPVYISNEFIDMVDGGVRNMSPLGDVLDTDPDEVVIINYNNREQKETAVLLRNVLEIGIHSLEIAPNVIFLTDLREFIRINKKVREATVKGMIVVSQP